MIQIPLDDMIEKIREQTELSKEEIEEKIKKKLDQLSGLISKEGAAHIIANELGVKLIATGIIKINEVMIGMRSLETAGVVTQNFGSREFQVEGRTGKVANAVIADDTGSIRLVCWGDQADKFSQLNQGDTVKIAGGYSKDNQGRCEIHINDKSLLTINPEGIKITVSNAPAPVLRKTIDELKGNEDNIELLATVVQLFDPRFYEVCPECNKRSKLNEENKCICPVHGEVLPKYSYLINAFLDDGTGNIQAVFFRDLVNSLLGKSDDEVLSIKDNTLEIEKVKSDLQGLIIKVSGRVVNNLAFDRIEFIVKNVDRKPDPEAELKALDKGTSADV